MKLLFIALIVLSASGCSGTISNLVYEAAKTNLPNVSATLSANSESIIWSFNPREEKIVELSDYSWQTLHRGNENNWRWEIFGAQDFMLSEEEAKEWDALLSKLTRHSVAILPEVIDTDIVIYLVPSPERYVSVSTPNVSDEISVPFIVWSHPESERHLPSLFADQSDVIGDLGSAVQLGYYAKNLVPHPEEPTASKLKKYANSSCWRLAVRPALALGSSHKVKTPPATYGSMLGLFENMYKENENEVEAILVYSSGLLVSDADDYMASLDMNWPQSGRDEAEISALLDFCESYLKDEKDPRD